jgi:hypothetical protein
MSMTIAESRVDEMQRSLVALVRVLEKRLPALERKLAEIRRPARDRIGRSARLA